MTDFLLHSIHLVGLAFLDAVLTYLDFRLHTMLACEDQQMGRMEYP